ncbi:MAG: ECF transporter S component [Clostridia bacterium]|nr:ECF transporter S component [Clostridia bacterium]
MQNSRNRNQTQRERNKAVILKMVLMACLVSIVVIFQLMGSFIKIGPTNVSLVLIPIVIGSILLGPLAGTALGAIFGIVVLLAGINGVDLFTATLWQNQPLETAILCIGKGARAGLCSGLVYKAVSKFGDLAAVIAASAVAPIVNTGVFILGGLFMVGKTLNANFVNGTTLVYYLVIVCAGLNFIAEFILNVVVSPTIKTIINYGKKALFPDSDKK